MKKNKTSTTFTIREKTPPKTLSKAMHATESKFFILKCKIDLKVWNRQWRSSPLPTDVVRVRVAHVSGGVFTQEKDTLDLWWSANCRSEELVFSHLMQECAGSRLATASNFVLKHLKWEVWHNKFGLRCHDMVNTLTMRGNTTVFHTKCTS